MNRGVRDMAAMPAVLYTFGTPHQLLLQRRSINICPFNTPLLLGDFVYSGVIPSIAMRFFIAAVLGLLTPSLAAASTNFTAPSRLALPADFKPPQVFRNTNLVRNINLEKSYVRETVNVVVENVGELPASEYYAPFPSEVFHRVGGFEVRDKKTPENGRFNVVVTETDQPRYVLIGKPSSFQVKVNRKHPRIWRL